MPQINEIYRQAAEWSSQADTEDFSAEQQRALDAWLDQDPRHLGAYLSVRASLARIDRLGSAAIQAEAKAEIRPIPFVPRKRFRLVGAIAASLLAVVLGSAVWSANSYEAAYATAVGETKTVALPDGSAVTMNTATSLSVRYNLLGRDIILNRGEALFDVAKHKMRPFDVAAGKSYVRAVGTSFEVTSLSDRPLQVMVREGRVEVKAANQVVAVSAGARAVVATGGQIALQQLPEGQVANELAWRDGYIFFRRQTLAGAAKELNRYSKRHIVIEDPSLADKTVTGRYVSTDPVGFANALAILWNLKVVVNQDSVHLTRKTL